MVLTKIFKALSDPNRLRALAALYGGELCVCQIVALLGLAPSTVSKHMSLLAEAGLVASNKRGRWVYYHLAEPGSAPVGRLLAMLPELLASESRLAEDREILKRILALDPETLCRMSGDAREFEQNPGLAIARQDR